MRLTGTFATASVTGANYCLAVIDRLQVEKRVSLFVQVLNVTYFVVCGDNQYIIIIFV